MVRIKWFILCCVMVCLLPLMFTFGRLQCWLAGEHKMLMGSLKHPKCYHCGMGIPWKELL